MARRQKSSRRQRPEPEAVDVLPEGMELELEVQLDGDDPFAEEPEEEAPTEPEGLSSQHAEHMELSASSDVLTTPGVWLLAVLDSLVLSAGIVLIAAAIAERLWKMFKSYEEGSGKEMLQKDALEAICSCARITLSDDDYRALDKTASEITSAAELCKYLAQLLSRTHNSSRNFVLVSLSEAETLRRVMLMPALVLTYTRHLPLRGC